MQFSKLKKSFERFLCPSLRGRVHLHAAVYRHSHDNQSRVWLTLDKKQFFSAEDLSFTMQHYKREQQIIKEESLQRIPYNDDWTIMLNSPERKALIEASQIAEEELLNKGIFTSFHFYDALQKYPNLSIDEALNNQNPLIRALALFDRRVGKRKLLTIQRCTHPVEQLFLQIRNEAESKGEKALQSK